MSGIVWSRPPSALVADIEAYGRRIQAAIGAAGQLLAAKLQAFAQAHAPWTDRTGQARQGLTGLALVAADMVHVYLFHRSDHGKWLEIARGGPYRIIVPTLVAHYGEVMALIAGILGGA